MSEEPSKVVSIRDGIAIRPPGEPDPGLVATIERLLEQARSGELMSMVAVVTHADESCTNCWGGPIGLRAIGALECIKAELIERINGTP